MVDLDLRRVGAERDQVAAHVLAQREEDVAAAEQPLQHALAVAVALAGNEVAS